MADRFDRFTEGARRVLGLAQDEARRLNHDHLGTEHLLLGLVRERAGVAARVLDNLGVQLPRVRPAVESVIGRGGARSAGEIGLTPRAKKVIELAVDEARRLDHPAVGAEHLLLGLVREGEGVAAGVLEHLGVNLERTRAQVMQIIADEGFRPRSAPRLVPHARLPRGFGAGTVVPLQPEPAVGAPAHEEARPLTDPARLAMDRARDEAARLNHNYIGTEHQLLGLIAVTGSNAARVLAGHGVERTKVRSAVEFIVGRGESTIVGEIGLTPRAKKVIEFADYEAARLGSRYLGTEHLLLGLVREGEGIAAAVLDSLRVSMWQLRLAVSEGLVRGSNDSSAQSPGDEAGGPDRA